MIIPYQGELLALGSALAWAVGIILFRQAGRSVSPLALNLFKNVLALVLLAATLLVIGKAVLLPLPTRDLWLILASGVIGLGISDTFLLAALNRLGAGLNAILWTFYSPMVILLSWLLLGEHLTLLQWAGVSAVLMALLLVTRRNGGSGEVERKRLLVGILFALLAMGLQAISVVAIKPSLNRAPVMVATELRLLGALAFLVPAILLRKGRRNALRSLLDRSNLKILLPGAFFGTYLSLTFMLGGIKFTLASTATVLNQTSNLFIFLLAVVFLREESGWKRWVGILLGLLGALLVTLGG